MWALVGECLFWALIVALLALGCVGFACSLSEPVYTPEPLEPPEPERRRIDLRL